MKKIKDICILLNGYSFKSNMYVNDGYRVIRITNVQKGKIEDKNPVFYDSDKKLEKYELKVNDILISLTGNVGRVGLVDDSILPAYLNQRVGCLRVIDKSVLPRYLFYILNSLKFENDCIKTSNGVAQLNLSTEWIKEYEIEIPSLKEQEKFVEKMDLINHSIDIRKRQVIECNNLVKSQFVEMFGNPIVNEKNWKKIKNKELCSKIGSGATPKGGNSVYLKDGIAFIRSMNVYDDLFEYKDLAFLNDRLANELKNVIVETNDILLNITGASVCRCCIVPKNLIPARVNQHVSILRYKKCNPIFILHQFINETFKNNLYKISKNGGATREALTKAQLEDLELILPPIKLQNKFAQVVEQIDKQKFEFEKQLKKLEELQASLMQQYFG